MAWVIDTSVLIDVRTNDKTFGAASAQCLTAHLPEGLLIAPVTYVELAPAFLGKASLQNVFLAQIGVDWFEPWTERDTVKAHALWAEHVKMKRSGSVGRRPVADLFIEAFAQRFQGVITRNPRDFSTVTVVVP